MKSWIRSGNMKIKKWTSSQIKRAFYIRNGGAKMENCLRINKFALKEMLMRNIKIDAKGRPIISQDDEWNDEDEWDDIYDRSETK
ncbi:hypothetical protein ADU80_00345 (plasmid) [Clostridium botulinum]|uniref:Uncharacterized protein n=2 Tax=Clostridium botulinum TaxID=1491 RepID=A0A9Q1UX24_CLOBO|nr:hypothetical protein CbC4_4157 [Clostridium botulinum BKT015925]KEH96345.1 hypothetical protein Y848_13785 [Clostridium botulinum C/D str. Sp77]KLU74450.1 hypothetical protein CBC3_p0155 [Clostridium botulinum V891]KOA79525.1 hypothetical protein ADU77_03870 [Clostridium botulinum]MCD3196313.1 hypothetical protein [Clostridium botulinum C/D]